MGHGYGKFVIVLVLLVVPFFGFCASPPDPQLTEISQHLQSIDDKLADLSAIKDASLQISSNSYSGFSVVSLLAMMFGGQLLHTAVLVWVGRPRG